MLTIDCQQVPADDMTERQGPGLPAEAIHEGLQQRGATEYVCIAREVVDHLSGDEDNEFGPCPRSHDIEPIEAHQELVFGGDRVRISKSKRR